MSEFLTAEELDIPESHLGALIKTLELMEDGRIHHQQLPNVYINIGSDEFTGHFNMAVWNSRQSCGTVGCIGGTAELVGNITIDADSDALDDLFYPTCARDYREISMAEASQALRNYLQTGHAEWKQVLGEVA